ncbi:Tip elongation aberrant protein-like protein [Emericellopsis cladophorae]|uniref:Tip elongation aberrant protein-like protein n=1 Tax=Emericellopsis cladophorae TaxID=2686198 RepID=A0A9P9XUY1_9HYPO|nr:Tip elongation aberrant protein-like protein [Emericellopsis cladophorae]KAI6778210.1 Tip elongation aberrant protein-like protein [Emericellopsis cladophorae]
MAFLFSKSKKNQDRSLASRDGSAGQGSPQNAAGRGPASEKSSSQHRATPTGSLNSVEKNSIETEGMPNSPDRGTHERRGGSIDNPKLPPQLAQPLVQQQRQAQPQSDLPLRNGPPPPAMNNASLYPWSQRRLTYTSSHPSPFPRYGAAVNSISSKEGDIYMMGGLINSSTVKGDLWMIEAGGNMACYPLATTAEGPGPRVGHSSLLVGNAFIVYGGDTKIDESDVLDETLYLLNTSTRQWSRALPAGPRPSGRYGHSLNIIGSKIYIFGGQVENEFMNDMSAFDLNQLQLPNNRWEILLHGDSSQNTPAARTNHSVITYNDKMYLFGGTNGIQWFNDVWCYDPAFNQWAQLDCIGYIPAAREGHAAALVDDVMYIFGGRTEEGTDLGDLAAFRISTRRWYTFQNMGPSPSPRSGHSMTTVGKSIVTVGGEPSSATSSANDLGILYVLDTTKIRYPSDNQQSQQQRLPHGQGRRPSVSDGSNAARIGSTRDGSNGPDQRRLIGVTNNAGTPPNGHRTPPPHYAEAGVQGFQGVVGGPGSKLPRIAPSAAGPPPSGPVPMRPGEQASAIGRVRGPSADRAGPAGSPLIGSNQNSPITREPIMENEPVIPPPVGVGMNGRSTPTQQSQAQQTKSAPRQESSDTSRSQARQTGSKASVDSAIEPGLKAMQPPASPPPPTRQPSNPLSRRSSGRNSQTVVLLKELDSARNRNAWYASELELARKGGFVPSTSSPVLDGKIPETFDDEDRPLIEALLAMRTELAKVQGAIDQQATVASKQIAEVERQRDAAVQEALYAKAKLASQLGDASADQTFTPADASFRTGEMERKLGAALQYQKELQSQLAQARADLNNEKKARKLADDTTNAAEKRMTALETYKQQTSTEVERLKAELHAAQREAREKSVASAEAIASLELLKAEKDDVVSKYENVKGSSEDHDATFVSLRAAIASSEDGKAHLQTKLNEERAQCEVLESKYNKLKAELEARTAELAAVTQRLRDAEELAERHAHEAKTHREAVIAGLDKISVRDEGKSGKAESDRVLALQKQVQTSNDLVKQYQREADAAADKLRSAEERIAGLEQYQEQSSREGVGIRRQLQSALKDTQQLQALNTDLKNRLAAQQLETNAMTVQHSALKNILSERGISPTAAVRARGLASPRTSSPEQGRLKELESQLAGAHAAHEESKQAFAVQQQEADTMYREKLSQLENDYRSAVHYVKGTEQMLKQLKEQLNRYKTENGQLKSDIEELEGRLQSDGQANAAAADWEAERVALQKRIEGLESELRESGVHLEKELETVRTELRAVQRQRDEALTHGEQVTKDFGSHKTQFEQLRSENALLEQRAYDAEQKVSLLLDQVEHSVDNYRRQSKQAPSMNSEQGGGVNGAHSMGHVRNESSELESLHDAGNEVSNARNSAALDSLASELETLRTHWEATNKNYRLSTNFDLDANAVSGRKDADDNGLSESLADWRKKLDTEENTVSVDKVRHV